MRMNSRSALRGMCARFMGFQQALYCCPALAGLCGLEPETAYGQGKSPAHAKQIVLGRRWSTETCQIMSPPVVQVVFQPQRDNKGPDFNSLPSRNDPSQPVPTQVCPARAGCSQAGAGLCMSGAATCLVPDQSTVCWLAQARASAPLRAVLVMGFAAVLGPRACVTAACWCSLLQAGGSTAAQACTTWVGLAGLSVHKLGVAAACELNLLALPTARAGHRDCVRPLALDRCTALSAGPCNHRSPPSRR